MDGLSTAIFHKKGSRPGFLIHEGTNNVQVIAIAIK